MDDGQFVDSQHHTAREFNIVLGATMAVSLVFLFLSAVFGEALVDLLVDDDESSDVRVPVWERSTLPYKTDGEFGVALEVGPYEILPTENEWNSTHHFVEYTLPIEEGGAAPNGLISLAVWRPNVPEGVKVPVIAESGPYFQEPSVQTPTIEVPVAGSVKCSLTRSCPTGMPLPRYRFQAPGDQTIAWI